MTFGDLTMAGWIPHIFFVECEHGQHWNLHWPQKKDRVDQ